MLAVTCHVTAENRPSGTSDRRTTVRTIGIAGSCRMTRITSPHVRPRTADIWYWTMAARFPLWCFLPKQLTIASGFGRLGLHAPSLHFIAAIILASSYNRFIEKISVFFLEAYFFVFWYFLWSWRSTEVVKLSRCISMSFFKKYKKDWKSLLDVIL